jgi:hypothetical protein
MSYYIGKTTYQQEDENGRLKTKHDHYLIDALSFSEAEARMAVMASSQVTPTVTAIRPVRIAEIFENDYVGEIWYEAKTQFYSIDERSGKEKKIVNTIYLNQESLPAAVEKLTKELATTLVPYTIESIKVSPVTEYLPYHPTETKEAPYVATTN